MLTAICPRKKVPRSSKIIFVTKLYLMYCQSKTYSFTCVKLRFFGVFHILVFIGADTPLGRVVHGGALHDPGGGSKVIW